MVFYMQRGPRASDWSGHSWIHAGFPEKIPSGQLSPKVCYALITINNLFTSGRETHLKPFHCLFMDLGLNDFEIFGDGLNLR